MNRLEIALLFAATILVFASALIDPLVSISLLIVLVLALVIIRQIGRDDRWESR